MRLLLLAAAAALLALPAQAQTELATFAGTLVGADSYDRPASATGTVGSIFAEPPTTFRPYTFSVDTDGQYQLALTSEEFEGTLLLLYQGSFDPGSPLAGVVALNNTCSDQPAYTTSLPCTSVSGDDNFNTAGPLLLSAGVEYILVVSEFFASNQDGGFTGSILGPEDATVVIEEGLSEDLDVAVTPLSLDIPTTGGKARFRTTVSNNSDARIEGDVVVLVNGVERRRLSSALTAGGSQSFTVNLSFPARVPDGIYQVTFEARTAEGELLDTEGAFDVTVGSAMRQAAPSALGFTDRKTASDDGAQAGLAQYVAERRAAALLVGVQAGGSRAVTAKSKKSATQ